MDICFAATKLTYPFFPLPPGLVPQHEHRLDNEALKLRAVLGSGFCGSWTKSSAISLVIEETCTFTVIWDQYHRESAGSEGNARPELNSAAVRLQRRLYSLPALRVSSEQQTIEKFALEACRLAIMIYIDAVFWSIP